MLQTNSSDNRDPQRQLRNPYASDREITVAEQRLIEKYQPRSIIPEEIRPSLRDFSNEEKEALRSVRSGLQYYYSGIYLVTFCFLIGGVLGRVIGPQTSILVFWGTTLGILIILIGEIRCLAVPRETDGYLHVMLSVFFYALGVLLYFIKHLLQAGGNVPPGLFAQVAGLQLLFGFLANFFFLTFLICLTRYIKHQELYRQALKTRKALWSMLGFVFVVILVFFVLSNQFPRNGRQLAFVVFGLGVLGFVILVYSWLNRFTRLVQETCSAMVLD